MKKTNHLIIIAILGISSVTIAGIPDYIITGDEVKFYDKVRMGIPTGLVGIREEGKDRYKMSDVTAYRKDERVYEKMPVVKNNLNTGRYAFMEVVSYRNGMKVYRYRDYSAQNQNDEYRYLVYSGNRFVVEFDIKNYETLSTFFFRNNNYLTQVPGSENEKNRNFHF
jgi:hypothetical protein